MYTISKPAPPQDRRPMAAWMRSAYPGLTLRQWYAGQALIGILSRSEDHKRTAAQCANEARQIADAMIEASI